MNNRFPNKILGLERMRYTKRSGMRKMPLKYSLSSLRSEGEIKSFPNKQKLKEFNQHSATITDNCSKVFQLEDQRG